MAAPRCSPRITHVTHLKSVVSGTSIRPHGFRTISSAAGPGPVLVTPARSNGVMSRMPTKTLLRSLALTSIMGSPLLSKISVAIMGVFARSRSPLLNPDRNPIVKRLLRWTVYDHFCSGENVAEVRQSVADFKRAGFQGVILTYAKEVVLDPGLCVERNGNGAYSPAYYLMVNEWKKNTLETLHMLSPGDILSIKLTGAGPMAIEALEACAKMPEPMSEALNQLCEEAQQKRCRVWLDAEQQRLQPGIDKWALELMRRFNQAPQPLVYNTIQAYLKDAEANTDRHIEAAIRDSFSVGIKLVRGAYIEHEVRSLIHDTKADTDAAFDAVADKLVSQRLPLGLSSTSSTFPGSGLFLATHNGESTRKACETHRSRVETGQRTTVLECAQLAGMADDLSCELVEKYEQVAAEPTANLVQVPKAFKYLTWGSVGECLGYLHRRAIENGGAVGGNRHMADMMRTELKRRLLG